MSPDHLLKQPAYWYAMAGEARRLDAERRGGEAKRSSSLSAQLARRNRPGGVVATPLFPE